MKKLICALIVLAVSTAQAVTIHVDVANCPGPGSGTLGDPYCSIQTAIDNAVNADEVVVAPGTYFETIDFLGRAITVRSTDPTDPATVAATIIDGTVRIWDWCRRASAEGGRPDCDGPRSHPNMVQRQCPIGDREPTDEL